MTSNFQLATNFSCLKIVFVFLRFMLTYDLSANSILCTNDRISDVNWPIAGHRTTTRLRNNNDVS